MSNKEMIERTRKALEAFNKLPVAERLRLLVANGTIDETGEVIFGREAAKAQQEAANVNDPKQPDS